MAIRVNTNVDALIAQRHLGQTGDMFTRAVERLSSGMRINRAADDAAGLSISEKLRAQVRGTSQAARNAQDGISMIQTAEGALTQVHDMLQRMRELAIQGSNDTLSSLDRAAINSEVQQLRAEIDAISTRTTFNRKHLLEGNLEVTVETGNAGTTLAVNDTFGDGVDDDAILTAIDVERAETSTTYTLTDLGGGVLQLTDGTTTQDVTLTDMSANEELVVNFSDFGVRFRLLGRDATELAADVSAGLTGLAIVTNAINQTANFQIGPGTDQFFSVDFRQVDSESLDLDDALDTYDADQSVTNSKVLIDAVDDAINEVSQIRASLGASQNRLQYTIGNLNTGFENLTSSESRIRDADIPTESVEFNRALILRQTGTAVLAQANAGPQSVLRLLE